MWTRWRTPGACCCSTIRSSCAPTRRSWRACTRSLRRSRGKILLILPDQDFFSEQMQQDLIRLMHEPEIRYVSGGHLSTVLKTEDYIRTIRAFLAGQPD